MWYDAAIATDQADSVDNLDELKGALEVDKPYTRPSSPTADTAAESSMGRRSLQGNVTDLPTTHEELLYTGWGEDWEGVRDTFRTIHFIYYFAYVKIWGYLGGLLGDVFSAEHLVRRDHSSILNHNHDSIDRVGFAGDIRRRQWVWEQLRWQVSKM